MGTNLKPGKLILVYDVSRKNASYMVIHVINNSCQRSSRNEHFGNETAWAEIYSQCKFRTTAMQITSEIMTF